MRHVAVDAGEGITAMVRMRGPMTPEFHDAFAEIARLAARQLDPGSDRTAENDADRERDNLEAIRYAEAWEAE